MLNSILSWIVKNHKLLRDPIYSVEYIILTKRVEDCFIDETDLHIPLKLGKMNKTISKNKWKYLHKLCIPTKVRQLRWRMWLNPNYVPIKRDNGERCYCTYCPSKKLDIKHILYKCKYPRKIRDIFVEWAKGVAPTELRDSYSTIALKNRWKKDKIPPQRKLKQYPILEGIDTLMIIIKFNIWKRFTKYMFGEGPHVFININKVLEESFDDFRASAARHPKAVVDKCPPDWKPLFILNIMNYL